MVLWGFVSDVGDGDDSDGDGGGCGANRSEIIPVRRRPMVELMATMETLVAGVFKEGALWTEDG